MPTRFATLSLLAACTACGDDTMTLPDGPPDPCAPNMSYTGELLDWDSGGAVFMGVPGVTFALRGDASKTGVTAPNGRFDLMCIPRADGLVDVTTMASSPYLGGVAVATRDVIGAGAVLSLRTFSMTRRQDFGYLPALAHVFVHVHGMPRRVGTAAPAQVKKSFEGLPPATTWVDGDTGTDIYLGNIDPTGGTTLLTVTGGSAVGAGSIPLVPGQFTFVTVVGY